MASLSGVFNRHANNWHLSSRNKAKVLLRKLRDDAEAAIENLTDDEILEFDTLVKALNNYFNPDQRCEVYENALHDLKQGPGESRSAARSRAAAS